MDKDSLSRATDHIHDSQILQKDWDMAVFLLSRIVDAYKSHPDGKLGVGFTNGMFSEAHEFLNSIGYEVDPIYKKNFSPCEWDIRIAKIEQKAKKYIDGRFPC